MKHDRPPHVLPDGRLRLDSEVALPGLLDVLIVGGGPAGTAVAFRAKELGLSALVIELDDILKRIRDYDKDKPIKPDFGAGRQMGFPKAGPLIERLHFFDDIRGEDLCAAWKALYRRHSVPAQIGVELVGAELDAAGTWRVLVRNHCTNRDDTLHAKHVVLALGAGMPRRLDVPGDVRAIGNRLADVQRYVGASACVIGGGVSAVEAVIAISEAKAAAKDTTAVYWSYRGQNLPKVPQALDASMTRAISVTRNVRLLLGSEAQEVVEVDGRAVLRLRIAPGTHGSPPVTEDWPIIGPSPYRSSSESTGEWRPSLEFEAARVIACIGQEIDWKLINDIGIFHVAGGAQVRKAIPLNALLESRQPNVYVIGDTLNPSYLECEDFDGDVSEFRKVAHRGNIKAALIDGVRVADVIAQRLGGKAEIQIDLEFVGAVSPVSPSSASVKPATLTRLLDGAVEAEQFVLHTDRVTTIGRRDSDICFGGDTRLVDRHAAIVPNQDGYRLRDDSSQSGVFLHLAEGRERVVAPGTVARLGRQWLVLGSKRNPRLLAHHDARGRLVKQYQLSDGPQVVGRDAPDITLAADDGSLSRRHASIVVVGPGLFVRDLNSVNGTYLKIEGSCVLTEGDVVRIGGQALRFQFLREEKRFETRTIHTSSVSRLAVSGAVAADTAQTTVTFSNRGVSCPFRAGQTICEVAEANGVEIAADCHAGICGSDSVRIVSGGAHLNPMSGEERATLEDLCAVDPAVHRLACMARPTGPLVVEILDG
ncbi:MAG: FAD-dependent oxidoreductase [Acidobacteria bacterium]|nr:FAD-dependent oxidoreductase [Acidobacteriota bacterium]